MNSIAKYVPLMSILLFATLQCVTNPNVAGGTDMPDETRACIVGSVISTQGKALFGAGVSLCKLKAIIADPSDYVDSTHTDTAGRYRFDKVPLGSYRVLTLSQDSAQSAVSATVTIAAPTDTITQADTCVLGGGLQGAMQLTLQSGIIAYASLKDEPFASPLNAAGDFLLRGIPVGNHILVIAVRGAAVPVAVAAETVSVSSGPVATTATPIRFPFANNTNPVLFEDFEDSSFSSNNGGSWWSFTDSASGGHSAIGFTIADTPGAFGSRFCGHAHVQLDPTLSWAYGGMGAVLGDRSLGVYKGYDLSRLSTIDFDARGSGNPVCLEFWSPVGGYVEVDTLDSPGPAWAHYTLSLDSVVARMPASAQAQWATEAPFVTFVQWTMRQTPHKPDTADLWIDNVVFTFK